MRLDAWRDLQPLAKVLLVETLAAFNIREGNSFRLTAIGTAKKYKCAQKTARAVICGLEEKCWIERVGVRPGPTGQVGGVYALTCIDRKGHPVRGPFEEWTSEKVS